MAKLTADVTAPQKAATTAALLACWSVDWSAVSMAQNMAGPKGWSLVAYSVALKGGCSAASRVAQRAEEKGVRMAVSLGASMERSWVG